MLVKQFEDLNLAFNETINIVDSNGAIQRGYYKGSHQNGSDTFLFYNFNGGKIETISISASQRIYR